jgi:uncharacterized membrane protein YczE
MTNFGNLPLRYRPVRRLVSLYVGLFLYGSATSIMIAANLGLDPWDVFHVGLARILGVSVGSVVIGVGAVVLLCWIPIRQKPGLGTLSNVVLVGASVDLTSGIPHPHSLWMRWAYGLASIVVTGVASGLYLGARLGPGPRDGIMTGLVTRWHGRRYGSIRLVRTSIEVTVLLIGFLMGGTVGWMTLVYAAAIGPVMHVTIPLFSLKEPVRDRVSLAELDRAGAPAALGQPSKRERGDQQPTQTDRALEREVESNVPQRASTQGGPHAVETVP